MPYRRSRTVAVAEWPPLRQLVAAAQSECPPGHAEALSELAALAVRKIPIRGLLDPTASGDDEMFAAIDAIALRHLELARAKAAWRQSLDAAELSFERRDEIERAARQWMDVSDTAYFYTGLAFGLAFVCAYRAS
jgi:hypothetical protein